jgi:tRNA pseudouridine55 synthase
MDGLILVDKPIGMTSHDVVAFLRRLLGEKRVGHFGTLDPLASGLLLAAAGKATRLFPFFSRLNKSYRGRVRLGYSTDTYDGEGRPTSEESGEFPDLETILGALRGFQGEIAQLPPPFSAKKLRGKPLYAYARSRKPVDIRPSRVHIFSLRLMDYRPPFLELEVSCSSGTYIRALAHDLGRVLGCQGHLAGLVRTEIGGYRLEDAFALEAIRSHQERGETAEFLLPLEKLLPDMPKAVLNQAGVEFVRCGRLISPENISTPMTGVSPGLEKDQVVVRLFGESGKLVAFARPAGLPNHLAPFLVFL